VSPQSRYKFAIVCLKLKKYQEAELALTGALLPESNRVGCFTDHSLNLEENKFVPNGASGFYLLGQAFEK
jgi:hypothetical protein